MLVNQLARRAQVSPHVVRYYSRIGLLKPIRDPVNGYKRFRCADVERLRYIRAVQDLGLSLAEVKALLEAKQEGSAQCCTTMQALLLRHLTETRGRIEELRALEARIVKALAAWGTLRGCHSDHGDICPRLTSQPSR